MEDFVVYYRNAVDQETRNCILTKIYKQYEKLFDYFANKYSFMVEQEDLKQECYFALVKALEKYDPEAGARFMTFLYKCLVNHLVNYCRSNGSIFDLDNISSLNSKCSDDNDFEVVELIPSDYDLENEVIDKCFYDETMKVLNDLLEELDESSKEILVLHFIKGLSLEEVAKRQGVDYKHIKSVCYRSMNKLRRIAKRKDFEIIGYENAISHAYRSTYINFSRRGESSTETAAFLLMKVDSDLRKMDEEYELENE